MCAVKEVDYSKLKESIGNIMKLGEKGTIQYFCDRTGTDDDRKVAACIAMLKSEGRAELLQTDEAHQSCGSPIYMGVYGKPPK
jgi:hypothetical protein